MNKTDSKRHKSSSKPDFSRELELRAQGFLHIAGVDEVGRGPLAGPVVTAAVVLDPDCLPEGLNDSKKLSPKRREHLFNIIIQTADVGICAAPPSIIETLNIRGATLWAMRQAVISLATQPDHILVDGRDIPPGLPCPATYLIGGDGLSISIAAASIVAKVVRDRMCQTMHFDAPAFGFNKHMGYGTKVHTKALETHGACAHHRAAFGPVARALAATRATR